MFLGNKHQRKWTLLLIALVLAFVWLAGCGRTIAEDAGGRSTAVDPNQQQQLEKLNRTADELYRNASSGDFPAARKLLAGFGDQLATVPLTGVTAAEGANALTDAVAEAKRIYNASKPDPDLAVKAAARLRLGADAATHPKQPMWLQYYRVLIEDTVQFEQSVTVGNEAEAKDRLARLKDHYDTIRTSVWISRTPEEGQKLDSLLTFFTKYTEAGNFRQEVLKSGIGHWKEALDGVFRKSGDRTAYLPLAHPDKPILWTVTVGSLILAVLSFASWRMFRWDRSRIRKPGPRGQDGE